MKHVLRWRWVNKSDQVRLVVAVNLHVWGVAAEYLRWTGYNEIMLRVGCFYLSLDWGSARHGLYENLKES